MTARINTLIRELELISVREQAGIDLCKKHLDINATLVLDPTLLVGRKLFQKIVDSEKKDLHAGVFCYFLDPNNKKYFLANSASKSLGCECFGNLTDLRKDSIEEWVSSFIRADFVITDSFHGTCFAILFEKQFIALSNSSRGNARFQSLLKLVGLENRFVSDNVDPKEMLNRMKLLIDYKTVNKKLSFERAKSRGKLMEVILK
jgi:polysaccharide pyruvyl transferase WcaK-like protein